MICPHCNTDCQSLIKIENHPFINNSEICDSCLTYKDYLALKDGQDPGLILFENVITNQYDSFHIPVEHISGNKYKFKLKDEPNIEYLFVKGKFNNITRLRFRMAT